MASATTEQFKTARVARADSLKPGRAARGRVLVERLIGGWIYICGITSIILVLLIFLFVFREAFPLLREYSLWSFLTGKEWRPTDDPAVFGLVPLLLSSLLVTIGAIVISVPLGISSAIFIAEIAPRRLREILKILVELLASVPSVVLGFFGLTVLGPILQNVLKMDTGTNMLAGSITLAFMAIPTIATISEDALSSVSRETREGSLGLGATQWQTIQKVSVPAAASGIVAATMLGVGRAIGETMVVLMVTGNGVGQNLSSLMSGPKNPLVVFQNTFGAYGELCRTLTATIAAEMGEVAPGDSHYHALFLLGVVLFVITFLINFAADFALRRTQKASR
jgi:phosphate transport system permease protein